MATAQLVMQGICRRNGIAMSPGQEELMQKYVTILLEWNARINLVSRRDEENIWFSHILHSIAILILVDIPVGLSVMDMGSGGGLPGIPLSILRPDLRFTLLDSIGKKTKVLDDIRARLDLQNVDVVTGRAEDVGREKKYSHGYDIVVARAVSSLTNLLQWSRPYLRRSSSGPPAEPGRKTEARPVVPLPCLLALKGGDLSGEIEAARIKGGRHIVESIEMMFDGSLELGLEEKKLLLVDMK